MTSILALDPAWTATEPSGVAVLHLVKDRWKCVGLAPSYNQFLELAEGTPVDWKKVPSAGRPDVDALMDAAKTLLGGDSVDLVTVDMPVALTAIHEVNSNIPKTVLSHFVFVAALACLGGYQLFTTAYHVGYMWLLYAVVLFFIGMRHPVIVDPSPLGRTRSWLGFAALVIFLLTFTLAPVRASGL